MANNAIEIAAKYVLKLLNDDSEMKGWTPIDSVSIERKRDDTVLFFSNVDGDFVAHKLIGGNLVRPYFQKIDFSLESQIMPQIKAQIKDIVSEVKQNEHDAVAGREVTQKYAVIILKTDPSLGTYVKEDSLKF